MSSLSGGSSVDASDSVPNSDSPGTLQEEYVVLKACSLALVGIASALLNASVVFLFYKRSYLQTPGNRYILALSVSNMAAVVIVVPVNWLSLVLGEWPLGVMLCYSLGFFMLCVMAGSVWMVALITLDRYYAIVTPMLYSMKLTNHYSVEVLVIAWFISFVCTFPPVVGWSTYEYSKPKAMCIVVWNQHLSYAIFFTVTCAVVPFAIICVCYLRILKVARHSSRRVSQGNIVTSTLQPLTRRRGSRRTSLLINIRMNSPTKALRTIFLTVGSLVAVWCPFILELLYEAANGRSGTATWMQFASVWLACSMFSVNPVVYAVWNKSIRAEIIGQYFPCCPRNCRQGPKDETLFFTARRDSHAVSISGSIADGSSSATASVGPSRFSATMTTRLGAGNGSNDSGMALTCIEEYEDGDLQKAPLVKKVQYKSPKTTTFDLAPAEVILPGQLVAAAEVHNDGIPSQVPRSPSTHKAKVTLDGNSESPDDEGMALTCIEEYEDGDLQKAPLVKKVQYKSPKTTTFDLAPAEVILPGQLVAAAEVHNDGIPSQVPRSPSTHKAKVTLDGNSESPDDEGISVVEVT